MAEVVVTVKIMPESPGTDLDAVSSAAVEKLRAAGSGSQKVQIEPVAFGLKSVVVMFTMPEEKGSTDDLERQLSEIAGVNSVQVTDVRRAVG